MYPIRNEHPCIKRSADDSASFDQYFYLFIAELTIVIDKCSAIVMTRPYMSMKNFHCIPERIVTEMCGIEDDIELFHFFQQGFSVFIQMAGCICPVCVA